MCVSRGIWWFLGRGFVFFYLGLCACGGGGGGGGRPDFGGGSTEFSAQAGLAQVSVAPAYAAGITGRSVAVAVADSGIDGQHDEFSGRLHPGYDWQQNSDGRIDPNGHGTHVASILGGAQNGVGMHGIAPQVQIYPYRLLDAGGYFGRQSGENMIPSLVRHASQHSIRVVNNSWGSSVEINDVTRQDIETSLPRELSAWQSAVNTGMVMVWAAGNDRDNQVSVRAGLPYYYSGLRSGWLAVVSSGSNGTEPIYTNRCGLAASWCITAPGGGDDYQKSGIWAARTGGGYTRKSGTSMAAPHVAGGVALLMQAFPSLGAQAAAARLLRTASYDGLRTAEGCTISSCGVSRMQAVFGQGRMNLSAALAPILNLSYAVNGRLYDRQSASFSAGRQLYGPLKNTLQNSYISALDDFDGAEFMHAVSAIITQDKTTAQAVIPSQAAQLDRVNDRTAFSHYLVNHHKSPHFKGRPEILFDVSSTKADFWVVLDNQFQINKNRRDGWTLRYRQQEAEKGVSVTYRMAFAPFHLWFGQGASMQKKGWLDATGTGPFSLDGGRAFWHFTGLQFTRKPVQAHAELLVGKSRLSLGNGYIQAGQANLFSWQAGAKFNTDENSYLSVQVSQPIRVISGQLSVYDIKTRHYQPVSLKPDPAETDLKISWNYDLSGNSQPGWLAASIYHLVKTQAREDHQKTEHQTAIGIGMKF